MEVRQPLLSKEQPKSVNVPKILVSLLILLFVFLILFHNLFIRNDHSLHFSPPRLTLPSFFSPLSSKQPIFPLDFRDESSVGQWEHPAYESVAESSVLEDEVDRPPGALLIQRVLHDYSGHESNIVEKAVGNSQMQKLVAQLATKHGKLSGKFKVHREYVVLPEKEKGKNCVKDSCKGEITFSIRCEKQYKDDDCPKGCSKAMFEMEAITPDEFSQSVWIQVGKDSKQKWDLGKSSELAWSNKSPLFTLPAGKHVLTLEGKDDGLTLGKIKIVKGRCDFVQDQQKQKESLGLYNVKCYAEGSNRKERDERCLGSLVCAKKGLDGRDFGGCDAPGVAGSKLYCCSRAPTDVLSMVNEFPEVKTVGKWEKFQELEDPSAETECTGLVKIVTSTGNLFVSNMHELGHIYSKTNKAHKYECSQYSCGESRQAVCMKSDLSGMKYKNGHDDLCWCEDSKRVYGEAPFGCQCKERYKPDFGIFSKTCDSSSLAVVGFESEKTPICFVRGDCKQTSSNAIPENFAVCNNTVKSPKVNLTTLEQFEFIGKRREIFLYEIPPKSFLFGDKSIGAILAIVDQSGKELVRVPQSESFYRFSNVRSEKKAVRMIYMVPKLVISTRHWRLTAQSKKIELLGKCEKFTDDDTCISAFSEDGSDCCVLDEHSKSTCLPYPEILRMKKADRAVCRQQATELVINHHLLQSMQLNWLSLISEVAQSSTEGLQIPELALLPDLDLKELSSKVSFSKTEMQKGPWWSLKFQVPMHVKLLRFRSPGREIVTRFEDTDESVLHEDEGAIVALSWEPCTKKACPHSSGRAYICSHIVSLSQEHGYYTVDCGNQVGRFLYIFAPGTRRVLQIADLTMDADMIDRPGVHVSFKHMKPKISVTSDRSQGDSKFPLNGRTDPFSSDCFLASSSKKPSSWTVDFGEVVYADIIRLWFYNNVYVTRLPALTIFADDEKCSSHIEASARSFFLDVPCPSRMSRLRIEVPGNSTLSLCDLKLFVKPKPPCSRDVCAECVPLQFRTKPNQCTKCYSNAVLTNEECHLGGVLLRDDATVQEVEEPVKYFQEWVMSFDIMLLKSKVESLTPIFSLKSSKKTAAISVKVEGETISLDIGRQKNICESFIDKKRWVSVAIECFGNHVEILIDGIEQCQEKLKTSVLLSQLQFESNQALAEHLKINNLIFKPATTGGLRILGQSPTLIQDIVGYGGFSLDLKPEFELNFAVRPIAFTGKPRKLLRIFPKESKDVCFPCIELSASDPLLDISITDSQGKLHKCAAHTFLPTDVITLVTVMMENKRMYVKYNGIMECMVKFEPPSMTREGFFRVGGASKQENALAFISDVVYDESSSDICPFGFQYAGGTCYRVILTQKTWHKANRYCQEYGGNLASMQTKSQSVFVQSMVGSQIRNADVWIGVQTAPGHTSFDKETKQMEFEENDPVDDAMAGEEDDEVSLGGEFDLNQLKSSGVDLNLFRKIDEIAVGSLASKNTTSFAIEYGWIDGTDMDYINWEGTDARFDVDLCVSMQSKSGFWSQEKCGMKLPFVCSVPAVCPKGFARKDSECVKYMTSLETYKAARSQCQKLGADLFDSASESNRALAVVNEFTNRVKKSAWVLCKNPRDKNCFTMPTKKELKEVYCRGREVRIEARVKGGTKGTYKVGSCVGDSNGKSLNQTCCLQYGIRELSCTNVVVAVDGAQHCDGTAEVQFEVPAFGCTTLVVSSPLEKHKCSGVYTKTKAMKFGDAVYAYSVNDVPIRYLYKKEDMWYCGTGFAENDRLMKFVVTKMNIVEGGYEKVSGDKGTTWNFRTDLRLQCAMKAQKCEQIELFSPKYRSFNGIYNVSKQLFRGANVYSNSKAKLTWKREGEWVAKTTKDSRTASFDDFFYTLPVTGGTFQASATKWRHDSIANIHCTTACEDVLNWRDSEGPQFDCKWYSQLNRCNLYGSRYSHNGKTAKQACCACDGGVSVSQNFRECPSGDAKPEKGAFCSRLDLKCSGMVCKNFQWCKLTRGGGIDCGAPLPGDWKEAPRETTVQPEEVRPYKRMGKIKGSNEELDAKMTMNGGPRKKDEDSKHNIDLTARVYNRKKLEKVPKPWVSSDDAGDGAEDAIVKYGPKPKQNYDKFFKKVKEKLKKKIRTDFKRERIVERTNPEKVQKQRAEDEQNEAEEDLDYYDYGHEKEAKPSLEKERKELIRKIRHADDEMNDVEGPAKGKNYRQDQAEEESEIESDLAYFDYHKELENLEKDGPIYERVKSKLKRKLDNRGMGKVPLKNHYARERYKKALIEKLKNAGEESVSSVDRSVVGSILKEGRNHPNARIEDLVEDWLQKNSRSVPTAVRNVVGKMEAPKLKKKKKQKRESVSNIVEEMEPGGLAADSNAEKQRRVKKKKNTSEGDSNVKVVKSKVKKRSSESKEVVKKHLPKHVLGLGGQDFASYKKKGNQEDWADYSKKGRHEDWVASGEEDLVAKAVAAVLARQRAGHNGKDSASAEEAEEEEEEYVEHGVSDDDNYEDAEEDSFDREEQETSEQQKRMQQNLDVDFLQADDDEEKSNEEKVQSRMQTKQRHSKKHIKAKNIFSRKRAHRGHHRRKQRFKRASHRKTRRRRKNLPRYHHDVDGMHGVELNSMAKEKDRLEKLVKASLREMSWQVENSGRRRLNKKKFEEKKPFVCSIQAKVPDMIHARARQLKLDREQYDPGRRRELGWARFEPDELEEEVENMETDRDIENMNDELENLFADGVEGRPFHFVLQSTARRVFAHSSSELPVGLHIPEGEAGEDSLKVRYHRLREESSAGQQSFLYKSIESPLACTGGYALCSYTQLQTLHGVVSKCTYGKYNMGWFQLGNCGKPAKVPDEEFVHCCSSYGNGEIAVGVKRFADSIRKWKRESSKVRRMTQIATDLDQSLQNFRNIGDEISASLKDSILVLDLISLLPNVGPRFQDYATSSRFFRKALQKIQKPLANFAKKVAAFASGTITKVNYVIDRIDQSLQKLDLVRDFTEVVVPWFTECTSSARSHGSFQHVKRRLLAQNHTVPARSNAHQMRELKKLSKKAKPVIHAITKLMHSMTAVLEKVESPGWMKELVDRYMHAGKRLLRVKEFSAKVKPLLDYSIEFPLPSEDCDSENSRRALEEDEEMKPEPAQKSTRTPKPEYEIFPGFEKSFYLSNGVPRVSSIFHLTKLDEAEVPRLLNQSLQFAYDPKIVGAVLDFVPGTERSAKGVVAIEFKEILHAGRFCDGLEPNECAVLGQKLLHEFSAPTPSMECTGFNRHINIVENYRKFEGAVKFLAPEGNRGKKIDDSEDENYNFDEEDQMNWDRANAFKDSEESQDEDENEDGDRRRRLKEGRELITVSQGLAQAARTSGARYAKQVRHIGADVKRIEKYVKDGMQCLTPEFRPVKFEKFLVEVRTAMDLPWMKPASLLLERKISNVMKSFGLTSGFTFPGLPIDPPENFDLNIEPLAEFVKRGTDAVDMISKLIEDMNESAFAVPSCCRPVPASIKKILLKVRKSAGQTLQAWRARQGRTVDVSSEPTTTTTKAQEKSESTTAKPEKSKSTTTAKPRKEQATTMKLKSTTTPSSKASQKTKSTTTPDKEAFLSKIRKQPPSREEVERAYPSNEVATAQSPWPRLENSDVAKLMEPESEGGEPRLSHGDSDTIRFQLEPRETDGVNDEGVEWEEDPVMEEKEDENWRRMFLKKLHEEESEEWRKKFLLNLNEDD